jgi:hypothetical protein
MRTPSPSQSSLASLTGGSVSSCNSPIPASPRTVGLGRCLSPLLIPSTRAHTPEVNLSAPPASPLGAIQPDLYMRKDGPLFIGSSPKSGPSLGRLHFRLKYDFDRSDLIVHLIEGKNTYFFGFYKNIVKQNKSAGNYVSSSLLNNFWCSSP